MKKKILFILNLLPLTLFAQTDDVSTPVDTAVNITVEQQQVTYVKPKTFSFLTNIPKDLAGFTKHSFQKKQLKTLAIVAGSSAILILADQMITNSVQSNLRDANIHGTENFSPIVQIKLGGKQTNFGKMPKNINTAFYNLGQGSFSMLFATGFFILGKVKKDNRALRTASQLTESFIALGLTTQLLKYSTGRENPSDATQTGGRWQPFPSWSNFQNHKPTYDAFPSGHLATFVSTVTIIGENYPEIRWIRPVGYALTGLIGLSMINNGVHWAGDLPLGIALGYGFGKFITKKTGLKLVSAR
jgi:hypothetical protein